MLSDRRGSIQRVSWCVAVCWCISELSPDKSNDFSGDLLLLSYEDFVRKVLSRDTSDTLKNLLEFCDCFDNDKKKKRSPTLDYDPGKIFSRLTFI